MNNINILITGSSGQLGSELRMLNDKFKMLNYRCFFIDKNDLDITDFQRVKDFIEKNDIKIIINTAAYTAVDKAEEEKELAELINYKAVENLAKISKEKDIFLVHISTDYVFNGKNYRPYVEEDKTDPINYYGLTKLKGEEAIKKINPKGVIIRTSWVYSSFGKNFVKTMLNLAKTKKELNIIFDQIGTPTYARDLAEVILRILDVKFKITDSNNNLTSNIKHLPSNVEIYHYSNEGVCSWYDFAKAIFEIEGIDIKVNPIESKDYPTPAKRPFYSVLNKSKIKRDFNIEIPYWIDSLKECLERLYDE